jgi:hypothetical protein
LSWRARAHGEALHPTRECLAVARFDDEMHMIVLNREFDQPRAEPVLRLLQRAQDDPASSVSAQVPDAAEQLQGDEQGHAPSELAALAVLHARLRPVGLAACTGSGTAVRAVRERQLPRACSSHARRTLERRSD